jgi:hypothetical protein
MWMPDNTPPAPPSRRPDRLVQRGGWSGQGEKAETEGGERRVKTGPYTGVDGGVRCGMSGVGALQQRGCTA